ncbi:competence protein CoiA [Olivibacter jilunii]|uniref:competence protein CoiA n=1 Tax=Olivibacter jilunii TaxID=985016 RepID=UPI0010305884|nr:competence protein CoiA family protein [Olivibacter jilunii]
MKFALVDSKKTEATKGAVGVCPICSAELIAKCGEIKISHWAHKKIRNCDPWWENETEWHRSWKNNFPEEWQETSLCDEQTGEKHIADIYTLHKLVIEFQHSHIVPQERNLREAFYKKMVWVVDGTRLKNDYTRFFSRKDDFQEIKEAVFCVAFPDEHFPTAWSYSTVPIIFDFRGTESINDPKDMRNHLYCVFPKRIGNYAVLAIIPREFFIKGAQNGSWLRWAQNTNNSINQFNKESVNRTVIFHRRRQNSHPGSIQSNLKFQRRSEVKRRRF